MSPRARLWTARTSRPPNLRSGRLPLFNRVSSIEGNHRMGSRSGAEENRSSALPAAIARHGDFAPTSTVSGASCRGHPSLALSGVTWGREGYRHRVACLQGARATGPCDAELPRRNQAFTNPRHLPSRGRSRRNEGFLSPGKPSGSAPTPFSLPKSTRGGRPHGHWQLGQIGSGDRRTSLSSFDRSAPCDFCVRV